MAFNKRPPRGYFASQYPLPHRFSYVMRLGAEAPTKDTVILPILRSSEAVASADTIEVNPRNANFAVETGATCHPGSIVPRINFTLSLKLAQNAVVTDKVREMKCNWFPIYTSFLNSLEAEDEKTAIQVEDILELEHDVTNKDVNPNYSTVKLLSGSSMPLSTVNDADEALGDWGLTTTSVMESVAWDSSLFYDALQFHTSRGMLSKTIGQIKTVVLRQDFGYFHHSSNFTQPTVKRMNPFTFCGILINLPQSGTAEQLFEANDVTDIGHLDIRLRIRFDEWNPNFDQTP